MHFKTITATCLILTFLLTSIPAFAAGQRGRPQGPYKYKDVWSASHNNEAIDGITRGRCNVSGLRVSGQTNSGDVNWKLTFSQRLNRDSLQKVNAQGKTVWTDFPIDGEHTARITAKVRIQKTRTGYWKATANYQGRAVNGPFKGANVSGRITAKSI